MIRAIFLVLMLVFSVLSNAETFVCSAQSYTEKFYEKDSQLQRDVTGFFAYFVDEWLKKMGSPTYTVDQFDAEVVPNSNQHYEIVKYHFLAQITTHGSKKLRFELLKDSVYIQSGHDPLDNSILTCGPYSGLKPSFWIVATDEQGKQVDKFFVSVWGRDISYRYKLDL